jgi:hypothetical protein
METFEDEHFLLHRIKFLILVILQIPSIILSVFIFAFFVTHQALLRTPQNQALLLLLLVNFVQVSFDLPMPIHFYYLGHVSPATAAYCTWWTFFEYTLLTASEFIMATISIQRHMLVFQSHVLRIRWKRWLLHYLPLLLCLIYPIVLYLNLVVFYPCDGTQWDFTSNLCGLANCYLVYSKILGTADWAVDTGLPIVIILFANVALVVRFIQQKRRRQQIISWQKQRRMTLQLLSISCLYLIAFLPSVIIGLVQQLGSPTFAVQIQSNFIIDLSYLICLFIPWVCLRMIPELTRWVLGRLRLQHRARNTVGPTQTVHAGSR